MGMRSGRVPRRIFRVACPEQRPSPRCRGEFGAPGSEQSTHVSAGGSRARRAGRRC
jgi:hypothetical protein